MAGGKRSVKAMLKRARAKSEPFSVSLDGEDLTGTFGVVPFMQWQELLADNPPRDGDEADEAWGFCYATFFPAAIRACMTDPEMDDEDWDTFTSLLSQGDMVRLGAQVRLLNERLESVDLPKSPSASSGTTSPDSD